MIRIAFFGTEQFAARILQELLANAALDIVGVITQPPRPVGRSQTITPSPVHQVATAADKVILTPETLKNLDSLDAIHALGADLFIVAQYGLIIPQAVLDAAPRGAINVHGSVLPLYRGASPVQTALMNGDSMTGVTFMLMDAKMDHGAILEIQKLKINESDSTETLLARLAELASHHIASIINRWITGTLPAIEQNHDAATFTRMFTRTDALVNWRMEPATQIVNKLRAFTPWPGILLSVGGVQFKILSAHVSPELLTAGQIKLQNKKIIIGTAHESVEVTLIQPAGKSPMNAVAFCNGYRSLDGAITDDVL